MKIRCGYGIPLIELEEQGPKLDLVFNPDIQLITDEPKFQIHSIVSAINLSFQHYRFCKHLCSIVRL